MPEFTELENWLQCSPDLNRGLFSLGALQQKVRLQNLTHFPAETCANRLLGLADPEHIESSDRSAAKRLMVIKVKGAHVEFHLNVCDNDYCYFTV